MSTPQSALIDATLTSLLGLPGGNAVDLTVADDQALANGSVSLGGLLTALNNAGVGTDAPTALSTPVALNKLLEVAGLQVTAAGNLPAAAALEKLRTQTASVNTQTVKLGDLIDADMRSGPLASNQINLLDLVTGSASTFNDNHVVALRNVSLNGSDVGLSSVSTLTVSMVVIEPAVIACGATGTQFYSASVRIRVHLDLNAVGLNLTVPNLTSVRLNLTQLDLVAAVGRAAGSISAINATLGTLSLQVTPGVAELYLGTISDANFIDRSTPIDPNSELTPATIGNLALAVTILNASATVSAKGSAVGATPTAKTLSFSGPYPQTQTATTSANFATNLVNTLLGNLQVTVSSYSSTLGLAPQLLNTVIANVLSTVTTALRSTADSGVLKAVLTPLTNNVLDPLLAELGIKLGEASVTASAPYKIATGSACNDNLYCTDNDVCSASGVCSGTARSCSDNKACTDDVCDEAGDRCVSTLNATSCVINDACVASGGVDPMNACRACNPASSTSAYSPRTGSCDDGQFCTLEDSCIAGVCTGTLRLCNDNLTCTIDVCNEVMDACVYTVSGGCSINGACVAAGVSSTDPCKVCDPSKSTTDWSPAVSGTVCNDGQFCTTVDQCDSNGVCVGSGARCPSDGLNCTSELCNEATDSCTLSVTIGCLVGTQCFTEGASLPEQSCNVCKPASSTTAFTYDAFAARCDSDGDGLTDGYERNPDGTPVDHDQDGIPDFLDPDDDNDGIPNRNENDDPNGDGNPDDSRDLDEDGIPDYLDPDDDDDGRSTRKEREDAENHGADVDGDGTPNWYDFDSDGDGATDAAENYGNGDSNGDSVPDYVQSEVQPADDDRDGVPTGVECPTGKDSCPDSDGDRIPNWNDADDDGDGVLTQFELRNGVRKDTDRDGTFDYLDTDDDDDTQPTRMEAPDPNGDGDPRDARDTDGDGLPDYLDPDDDNDGVPTARENVNGGDGNGNGIPDYLEVADAGVADGSVTPRADASVSTRDASVDGAQPVVEDAGRSGSTGDSGCSLSARGNGAGFGALWVLAALGGLGWRRRKQR